MKNNFLFILVILFSSILFTYVIFFTYIFVKKYENYPYLFSTIEEVNFNKQYSKKLHHLRGHSKTKNKKKITDYMFTTIKNFKKNTNNVLFQGDSYVEQLVEESNNLSYMKVQDFVFKNEIGFINSGTTSYSPSLMQVQFDILEKDFDIKPNIVISYIDQTDIGDELCRYKNNKIYNSNGKLIAIKNTNYSRAVFEYTKINNLSEILLLNKNKIVVNYKLTNFFIKYSYKRFINKIQNIFRYGWEKKDVSKCHFSEITKYLKYIEADDLKYFENVVINYFEFLSKKNHVEKVFIITFPHYNHLFENDTKKKYNINVSNIIENLVQNYDNINHLNFSKLISDNEVKIDNNAYKPDRAHIKEKYYIEIFLNKIEEKILNALF